MVGSNAGRSSRVASVILEPPVRRLNACQGQKIPSAGRGPLRLFEADSAFDEAAPGAYLHRLFFKRHEGTADNSSHTLPKYRTLHRSITGFSVPGAGDAPFTFEYTLDLGLRSECGDYVVDNTATVVATDTGTADPFSATATVHVPCVVAEGCTPGFWKNNLAKHGASRWPVDPNSVSPFSGMTFAQAINQTGKNIIYARAAAAYLNALTLSGFPYSTDDVISLFNAGNLKSLAAANELGCPLSQ